MLRFELLYEENFFVWKSAHVPIVKRNETFREEPLRQAQMIALGLDTNIPKNALKIYPENLNFFP